MAAKEIAMRSNEEQHPTTLRELQDLCECLREAEQLIRKEHGAFVSPAARPRAPQFSLTDLMNALTDAALAQSSKSNSKSTSKRFPNDAPHVLAYVQYLSRRLHASASCSNKSNENNKAERRMRLVDQKASRTGAPPIYLCLAHRPAALVSFLPDFIRESAGVEGVEGVEFLDFLDVPEMRPCTSRLGKPGPAQVQRSGVNDNRVDNKRSREDEPMTSSGTQGGARKRRRVALPLAVRRAVWNQHFGERCGVAQCCCCRAEITQQQFECGHVQAVASGGEDTLDNLRPVCSSCNKSMGTANMDAFMHKFGLNAQGLGRPGLV